MTENEFVQRFFEIAEQSGLLVEERRPGRSICFNANSDKWLSEKHLRSLFPQVLEPNLSETQINCMIEDVAPGRPCTHKDFRAILKSLHLECGWVPGSGN
ncbi:hypothetical protein GV729_09260 [Pseudomonas sp. Fl4BN2]|nr:hypothetical protein [Pseudomonas sp. Fl4BN2]